MVFTGGAATLAGLHGMGSMDDYSKAVAKTRVLLSAQPEMREVIRYATLAPNGHNTQPWRFGIGTGSVEISPDLSRRTPIVDPDDHHLFVSLGCAGENLALALRARGKSGNLRFDPAHAGSLVFDFGDGPKAEMSLFDAIPRRQSTRSDYDGRQVGSNDLKAMAQAAMVPGVGLVMITEPSQISKVGELVIAGNSAQMANAAFMRELKAWLRFSPRQAIDTGDGLFTATSGNPPLPVWLGPRIFDWFFNADDENDKYARQMQSSAGVAVFIAQQADPDHWIRIGRACQRFALQATALGVKCAFMNQPVEVVNLRSDLAALVGMPDRRPDIVLRFGYGRNVLFSARRPVEQAMV
jgi:nitroreductase